MSVFSRIKNKSNGCLVTYSLVIWTCLNAVAKLIVYFVLIDSTKLYLTKTDSKKCPGNARIRILAKIWCIKASLEINNFRLYSSLLVYSRRPKTLGTTCVVLGSRRIS